MAEGSRTLHVALFPWLAFGHMLPAMELANRLARRGHRVSYISTPRNIRRLPKPLSPLITFVELPLPPIDGLPPNAESTMDLPVHLAPLLKSAVDGLQAPLKRLLQTESPDWIIQDFLTYWLPPIAADLGISSAFFSIYPAWFLVFAGPVRSLADGSFNRKVTEDFTTPPDWVPFPSKLAFRPYQADQIIVTYQENQSGVSDTFRYSRLIMGCDACFVRTCPEFEADWLRILRDINGKPAIPVGLLPPSDGGEADNQDGAWELVSGWLD